MKASRLLSLPPYLFEELENRYGAAVGQGRDVIDLSIGDPDLPPPDSLIASLERALSSGRYHRYPPQRGNPELKASIRRYLARRCGVEAEDNEILVLCGSNEGIAQLPLSVCNPGDVVVLPDPAYPVYHSAATFAGCSVSTMPLRSAEGFLPVFEGVTDLKRARICFLNYPNNPTSATGDAGVFASALELGERNGTIVANDAAYADVYFDDQPPPLLCGQPDALRYPMIEFFSFSKSFSITGWRVGFAVGRRDVIEALAHMKANVDSGVFGAVQRAVGETLDKDGDRYATWMRGKYQERRDAALAGLKRLGFQCFPACATFYTWVGVPSPWRSMDYALHVLEKADVLVTPGAGFGEGGEGFFRIALTQSVERLSEAFDRISRI